MTTIRKEAITRSLESITTNYEQALTARTEAHYKTIQERDKLRDALRAALGDIDLAANIFSKQYHAAAGELAPEIYRDVLKGVSSNGQ